MYPRININLAHYQHNINTLQSKLAKIDEIFVVTKAYSAYSPIIDMLYETGIRNFADSRIQNLKSIKEKYPDVTTLQLRLPMASEISELVKFVNRSLVSELTTIKLIDEECKRVNKKHEIILMIDVGDLREGIMFDSDYVSFAREIIKFKNINLIGVGFNVTCYGSIIPTKENLNQLITIRNDIENELNIKLPIISGGNSSSIYLALDSDFPKEVNNLRIGDAFLSGVEAAYNEKIQDMYYDIFELEAQIVEIKEKPSLPIGKSGLNAFGEKVEFEDVGIHTRAIIAIGRQDILQSDLIVQDEDIKILGSSSDHTILEVKPNKYHVGDTIKFSLKYGGVLSLFTSKYVSKNIIKK